MFVQLELAKGRHPPGSHFILELGNGYSFPAIPKTNGINRTQAAAHRGRGDFTSVSASRKPVPRLKAKKFDKRPILPASQWPGNGNCH